MNRDKREFGATNAPGTCLWCGDRLRPHYHTVKERTDRKRPPTRCYSCDQEDGFERIGPDDWDRPFRCKRCGNDVYGEHRMRIVSRTRLPRPLGLGGTFCTGACAQRFAFAAAASGTRLKTKRPSLKEILDAAGARSLADSDPE